MMPVVSRNTPVLVLHIQHQALHVKSLVLTYFMHTHTLHKNEQINDLHSVIAGWFGIWRLQNKEAKTGYIN